MPLLLWHWHWPCQWVLRSYKKSTGLAICYPYSNLLLMHSFCILSPLPLTPFFCFHSKFYPHPHCPLVQVSQIVVHSISLLFVVFLWWTVSERTIDRDAVWVYLMTQVEISEMCVPVMECCSSLFSAVIFSAAIFCAATFHFFFQTKVSYADIIFTIWKVIISYYYY